MIASAVRASLKKLKNILSNISQIIVSKSNFIKCRSNIKNLKKKSLICIQKSPCPIKRNGISKFKSNQIEFQNANENSK